MGNNNQLSKVQPTEGGKSDRHLRQPVILLAEDDDEMRSLLAGLLEKKGYQVQECINGMQLLEHFGDFADDRQIEKIDLIISDIRMPGFTGMEILDFLHDNGGFPPVFLITAFGDYRIHAEAERLGVAAFLDKPFDLDEFMDTVTRLLEKGQPEKKSKIKSQSIDGAGPAFPLDIIFRGGPRLPHVVETIRAKAKELETIGQRIIFCRVIIENHHSDNAPEFHFVRMILTIPGEVFVVANNDHDMDDMPDLLGSINELFLVLQGKVRKHAEQSKSSS
jgi:FixJ family two-component response regulator